MVGSRKSVYSIKSKEPFETINDGSTSSLTSQDTESYNSISNANSSRHSKLSSSESFSDIEESGTSSNQHRYFTRSKGKLSNGRISCTILQPKVSVPSRENQRQNFKTVIYPPTPSLHKPETYASFRNGNRSLLECVSLNRLLTYLTYAAIVALLVWFFYAHLNSSGSSLRGCVLELIKIKNPLSSLRGDCRTMAALKFDNLEKDTVEKLIKVENLLKEIKRDQLRLKDSS